FGLIARAVVGKDGDDRFAGSKLLRQPDGAGDIDSGGAAEAEALMLEQVENEGQRFLVGYQVGFVDFQSVDDRRDAAKADAFGYGAAFGRFCLAILEQMVHRRPARIGDADDDVLVLFPEEGGDAGNGAAGADRANEAVDMAIAIVPDLRT